MYKYDVTWSIGRVAARSIADASDEAQFAETQGDGRAWPPRQQRNCQVMIEGRPRADGSDSSGISSSNRSGADEAPFYVLGPIVTDIAPGYDHITSAIGAAMAAWYGRGDAVLRDAEGGPLGLAQPGRRPSGVIGVQDRRARRRLGSPSHRRPFARRRLEPCPIRVRLDRAVSPVARSETARRMHDEALPARRR